MTFDAWWAVMQWLLLPALGGLLWWIERLRRDLSAAKAALYERLREAEQAAGRSVEACRAEHREELKALRGELSAHRVEIARTYATDDRVEKAVGKLESAMERLAGKIDLALRSVIARDRQVGRRGSRAEDLEET